MNFLILVVQFPAWLTQLRKASGLTQQTLASVAEVHVDQIRRYEAGSAQPGTGNRRLRAARDLEIHAKGE